MTTKPPRQAQPRKLASDRATRQRVEEVFRQWRVERPDIDPDPVHIYGLIARIHIRSTYFIDEALQPFGLVRGTFDVLTALRRAGTPYAMTPKKLTEFLLLSGAGLNSRLNKLEAQHYIARVPEPNDRRTVLIQLTAQGEAAIEAAIPLMFEAQAQRLRQMPPKDREALVTGLLQFADILDADV